LFKPKGAQALPAYDLGDMQTGVDVLVVEAANRLKVIQPGEGCLVASKGLKQLKQLSMFVHC
jgi:hypothetical protein